MIETFAIRDGGLVPTAPRQGEVDLYLNPDPAEREAIRAEFVADEHTINSALDPDEVARLESSGDNLVLIWKRPVSYSRESSMLFESASFGVLLSGKRLALVSSTAIDLPRSMGRLAPALRTPFDVALALISSTIQHYLEHLKVIKSIARELQNKINRDMENRHLIQMFSLSESLIYYVNAIHNNGIVLTRLRRHAEGSFSPEILAIIDDLQIENDQCFKQAEIYSNVLSGLMDARGSIVNNNMNILLKNLTIINVIFLPLNLIAGIFGMSEFTGMTRGVNPYLAYAIFCLLILAIGWMTGVLLNRWTARSNRRRD
jgi:magnesium transporter